MPTIMDVAKAAGVSTATISRVVNGNGYVKEETKQRVLDVIQDLGYFPSAIGQSLRRNRTNVIMVIARELNNPFLATVIRSIESVARDHEYSVILHEYSPDLMRADDLEHFISTRKIDGMIFLTAEAKLKEFQRISEKCPTVLACEYVEYMDIPSISIDNIAAVMDVMKYLVSLGHTDILFLNGTTENITCRDRLRGYRIYLEQNGLSFNPQLVIPVDCTSECAYQAVTQAFDTGKRFSAVFCGSDVMAIGAMKAVRDRGLRVPDDISIIGFDDIEFAEYIEPSLTTVYQPGSEIGELAMKMWLDLYEGKPVEYPLKMEHQLRIRNSCTFQC